MIVAGRDPIQVSVVFRVLDEAQAREFLGLGQGTQREELNRLAVNIGGKKRWLSTTLAAYAAGCPPWNK